MAAIDVWAQQPNKTFLAQPYFYSLKKWTGQDVEEIPLEFLLHTMEAADVSKALIAAWYGPQGTLISNEEVLDVVCQYPEELVSYMKGHGKNKVMFGTNYPMITAETCMTQLEQLDLSEEVTALFLLKNAEAVFNLS